MYIFLTTRSGGRTNIRSDIKIYDKDMLLEKMKSKEVSGIIRYAKTGEYTSRLNQMTLDQFEDCFGNDTPSKDVIDRYFPNVVKMKYGTMVERKKLKRIPKRELIVGGIYHMENGQKTVYLGNVKLFRTIRNYEYHYTVETTVTYDTLEKSGLLFVNCDPDNIRECLISEWKSIDGKTKTNIDYYLDVLKSCRKLVEYTGKKIDVTQEFYEKCTDGTELKITFLDVKE